MADKKKKDEDISFEESLEKLEEIVEKLEKGTLSLDEALKLYEEGMHFSDKCLEKLNATKKKVEKLSREGDQKYSTEPFSITGDEEANIE